MAEKDDDKNRFLVRLNKVPVRVSYPNVHRAQTFRGSGRGPSEDSGSKAFSCTFMIPKNSEAFDAYNDDILDAIDNALDDAFGTGKAPRIKDDKVCYRDGDDEDREEYHGHWVISARSTTRPKVVDADGKTPLVEEDGKPYGGCFCFGWIRIYISTEYKRVCASLEAVQFVKDGEAFGGRSQIDDEEFKDVREPAGRGRDRDRGSRADEDRDGRASDRRRESDKDSRSGSEEREGRDRRSRNSNRDDDRRVSRSRDDDDDDDRRGSRRLRA